MTELNKRHLRRVASLAVLIIAGVASLATSPGSIASYETVGSTRVGTSEAVVDVSVRIALAPQPTAPTVPASGQPATLEVNLRREAGLDPYSPVEANVQLLEGPPVEWARLPASVPLALEKCTSAPCVLDYRIRLRPVVPRADPFVVAWRLTATVERTRASSLALEVNGPRETTSLGALAATGFLAGVALALMALVGVSVGSRPGRRLAVLEIVGAASLAAAGLFLLLGLASGLTTWVLGALLIVAGLIVALLAYRSLRVTGGPTLWLIPLAMLAIPTMLSRFVLSAAFREEDVLVAFASAGFVAVVSVVSLAPGLRQMIARLRVGAIRTWVVVALAASLVLLAFAWAVLISAGATVSSAWMGLPFAVCYLAVSIALWQWLRGNRAWGPVVGFSQPVVAAVAFGGFVMAALSSIFTVHPPTLYTIESAVWIAVGGILMGALTLRPPAQRESVSRPI